MHIPTPTLRKRSKSQTDEEKALEQQQKRKASDTSVENQDRNERPARKKLSKERPKKEAKKKKGRMAKEDREADSAPRAATPADAEEHHDSHQEDIDYDATAGIPDKHSESPHAEPQTDNPRRSSRIKEGLHKASETWDKCRPYIERINGTIMPLEAKGTSVYYERDGMKT